jgi:putative aldouronate transport system substrate-binding protein
MKKRNFPKGLRFAAIVALLFTNAWFNVFAAGRQEQNAGNTDRKEAVHEITLIQAVNVRSGVPEVEIAVNKILEPKINTRVKYIALDQGVYSQQLSLIMASGEKADLVQGKPIGTANFTVMHAQRQLMDITDLLPQYAPDLVKTVTDIIPGFLDGTRINGRLYSVSCLYNKVLTDYYLARADMLDKYNIDIYKLKSLDDVAGVLDIFTKNEPQMAAIVTNQSDASALNWEGSAFYDDFTKPVFYDTLGDFVNRIAVVFIENPDKVVNLYKTDYYRRYVNRVRDWYKKGYIYKDALINTDGQETLIKNNVGISWTTGSELGVEIAKESLTGHKIRAVKMDPGIITTGAMTKFFWGIPAHSKEPEAALKFLNLLYTNADLNNLFVWGIEGRDYEVKPDGTVGYPAGVTATTVPYHSSDFMWGNQFITKVWYGSSPNLREEAKKENQNALNSPFLGFSFDIVPIQNEIAVLSNVISQYRPGLESGQVDPATGLPEFIKALDSAGAEKMVTEIQKQLDAWKAAKK